MPGYPQPLRQYGQGLPVHKIDTAIWWEPNGYTYFFSGDRCDILQMDIYHILTPFNFENLSPYDSIRLIACVQVLAIQ